MISHDRRFLNRIATHVLDVDYETVTLYTGNYDAFCEQKVATFERKEAEIAKQEKAVAEKRAFIDRFKAKASKARQAQSRVKQIEKIKIAELPQSSRRAAKFKFTPRRPSGRDVVKAEGIEKSYGEHKVPT